MDLNFHYAAYSYLDECLWIDRPCMLALRDKDRSDREICKALAMMAVKYSIIRNFSSKNCNEEFRLASVLEELRRTQKPVSDEDAIECVVSFADRLKELYGQRLLSAASKILWMQYQSPVIIFDSLAWGCLIRYAELASSASYSEYCRIWREEYKRTASQVRKACDDLIDFKQFTLASKFDDASLRNLVDNEWFRERVFDHALVLSESIARDEQGESL